MHLINQGAFNFERLTSSATTGPGALASALGPGAPTGGAGGLDNEGEGAGDPLFFLDFLLGAGAGTSAAGGEAVGVVAATGAGVGGAVAAAGGGELTGTAAAGGGELTGVAAAAGGVATGAAVGVAAGGEDAGAGDLGLLAAGAVAGAAGVAGVVVGAAAGAWPPTPATTTHTNARTSILFLPSISVFF
ncbi:unnamed protein product, partial [Linum tenue]